MSDKKNKGIEVRPRDCPKNTPVVADFWVYTCVPGKELYIAASVNQNDSLANLFRN